MRHTCGYLIGLILSGASIGAYAHHSHAAQYIPAQEHSIEGRVVQFSIRNPHSFLYVLSRSDGGEAQRWAIEWGSISALGPINRDTLKPGDEVVITGRPARDPQAYRLLMMSIERPSDGWSWSGEVR